MSKGLWIIVGIAAIATCLPIWRGAGHSRFDGVSLWQLVHESTELVWQEESQFGHVHLTYEEAVQQARQAWLEHCGAI